jgi:hypothetical protein
MMARTGISVLTMIAVVLLIGGPASGGEQDYTDLFPRALPGWTASKVEFKKTTEEDFLVPIARVQLAMSFVHDRTKGRVVILIDTFDPVAAAMIDAAHNDEKYLAGLKGTVKLYRLGTYQGFEHYEEGNNLVMISLVLSSGRVFSIGRENAGLEDMMRYLKKTDLEKIKAFSEK